MQVVVHIVKADRLSTAWIWAGKIRRLSFHLAPFDSVVDLEEVVDLILDVDGLSAALHAAPVLFIVFSQRVSWSATSLGSGLSGSRAASDVLGKRGGIRWGVEGLAELVKHTVAAHGVAARGEKNAEAILVVVLDAHGARRLGWVEPVSVDEPARKLMSCHGDERWWARDNVSFEQELGVGQGFEKVGEIVGKEEEKRERGGGT